MHKQSLRGVTAILVFIHHHSSLLIYLGKISYSTYIVYCFIQKSISLIYKSIFRMKFKTNLSIIHSVIIKTLYSLVVTLAASPTYTFVELKMQPYLKNTHFVKKYIFCGN
jgi:peptidoglycan/LPS O-acetylase OafA/YrhL